MTVSRQPDPAAASEVLVRSYADGDYDAGRSLWAELTEYHRSIYRDPSIGGDDPGSEFDGYLTTPQRIVLGLTGLLDQGGSAEVEPVVVAEAARNRGVARLLIGRVVQESRSRGYEYLAIRPVADDFRAARLRSFRAFVS